MQSAEEIVVLGAGRNRSWVAVEGLQCCAGRGSEQVLRGCLEASSADAGCPAGLRVDRASDGCVPAKRPGSGFGSQGLGE